MNEKIAWEIMKKTFPNEWLLITDFDLNQSGHIIAGIVKRHSKNKDDVYQLPALNTPTAFRYTGESSFNGFRSRVETNNDWETLPPYLQDSLDNMLADEAEQEKGDSISLRELMAMENDSQL